MVQKTIFAGYESLLLSNSEAELIITTSVGPRILSYRPINGENVLGLHLASEQPNALGNWKPYGGHRLWAAPEVMPSTYYPDNNPVDYEIISDNAVHVRAPIERETNIQKELRITLHEDSHVTIDHSIYNCGKTSIELAAWSLTILRNGGTTIVPQEPYRSHDDALLPARPVVLWQFTDLTDPRFRIGKKLLELTCDDRFSTPQKIGAMNKQGWAGYYTRDLLFVKEFDFDDGASYPDYGCNCEAYTAGDFMELESLGPMQILEPGKAAQHREQWKLFGQIMLPTEENSRAAILEKILSNA